jgi:hypothetical protein
MRMMNIFGVELNFQIAQEEETEAAEARNP